MEYTNDTERYDCEKLPANLSNVILSYIPKIVIKSTIEFKYGRV